MYTQKVSDAIFTEKRIKKVTTKIAFEMSLKQEVESCSNFLSRLIPVTCHAFLQSAHLAYAKHLPLVISPDILWLTIIQGVSIHINNNFESMRSKFVNFAGKQEIKIRNDTLIKGAMENPWMNVFDDFSKVIKDRIGFDNHSRLVVGFSTTGIIEKAVNEIMLMDIVKNYFDYTVRTKCCIPTVIIEGISEDYILIEKKVKEIGQAYDLSWWTERIIPLLDRIAKNCSGNQDKELWGNWYKLKIPGSGGPYITGYIINFFPYLLNNSDGKYTRKNEFSSNLTSDAFPASLCNVPFKWEYYEKIYSMNFIAGFVGLFQDKKTFAISPKIGWAVVDKNAQKDRDFFRVCEICKQELPYYEIQDAEPTRKKSTYDKAICFDCD